MEFVVSALSDKQLLDWPYVERGNQSFIDGEGLIVHVYHGSMQMSTNKGKTIHPPFDA